MYVFGTFPYSSAASVCESQGMSLMSVVQYVEFSASILPHTRHGIWLRKISSDCSFALNSGKNARQELVSCDSRIVKKTICIGPGRNDRYFDD